MICIMSNQLRCLNPNCNLLNNYVCPPLYQVRKCPNNDRSQHTYKNVIDCLQSQEKQKVLIVTTAFIPTTPCFTAQQQFTVQGASSVLTECHCHEFSQATSPNIWLLSSCQHHLNN